jgi:ATP-dependent Lon protease
MERKIKNQAHNKDPKEFQEEWEEVGLQEQEVVRLKEIIKTASLPPYIEKQALLEAERLRLISTASAEYGMVRTHIDWLLSLPWNQESCGLVNIERLERILREEFFGQEKVKEDILQIFSVRKLKKDLKGIVLCFAGPAGTGKTSLGMAVANALGRKFVRISVTGIRDEAEIKGTRSTYTEAFPGKILTAVKEAGCNNPLIMIENIDKMATENLKGDPATALSEALDPEKNSSFLDHYLGLPYDLSDVIFVTTALVTDEIYRRREIGDCQEIHLAHAVEKAWIDRSRSSIHGWGFEESDSAVHGRGGDKKFTKGDGEHLPSMCSCQNIPKLFSVRHYHR